MPGHKSHNLANVFSCLSVAAPLRKLNKTLTNLLGLSAILHDNEASLLAASLGLGGDGAGKENSDDSLEDKLRYIMADSIQVCQKS